MASRLQDVHLRTTTALKPLATAVAKGTLHYNTDTNLLTRSDGTTWQSYSVAGGGTGDVVGPAVAVDSDIALFDGVTGKLLKDSGITLAQLIALIGVQLIEEKNPTGVGTVTFASLGAFSHLQLWYSARSTQAAVSTALLMQFNGDTGANYDTQLLRANAAVVAGIEGLASSSITIGQIAGASATANLIGAGTINIFNYRGVTSFKGANATFGFQQSQTTSNTYIDTRSGFWRSLAAINSITLALGGGNFINSKISLYGLK